MFPLGEADLNVGDEPSGGASLSLSAATFDVDAVSESRNPGSEGDSENLENVALNSSYDHRIGQKSDLKPFSVTNKALFTIRQEGELFRITPANSPNKGPTRPPPVTSSYMNLNSETFDNDDVNNMLDPPRPLPGYFSQRPTSGMDREFQNEAARKMLRFQREVKENAPFAEQIRSGKGSGKGVLPKTSTTASSWRTQLEPGTLVEVFSASRGSWVLAEITLPTAELEFGRFVGVVYKDASGEGKNLDRFSNELRQPVEKGSPERSMHGEEPSMHAHHHRILRVHEEEDDGEVPVPKPRPNKKGPPEGKKGPPEGMHAHHHRVIRVEERVKEETSTSFVGASIEEEPYAENMKSDFMDLGSSMRQQSTEYEGNNRGSTERRQSSEDNFLNLGRPSE